MAEQTQAVNAPFLLRVDVTGCNQARERDCQEAEMLARNGLA